MTTFAGLLERERRADGARPLVTYYDLTPDGSGERTELSVTTYANWVAKTAGLLVEECDLERGDRLVVDLPTHWLGPVVLGAAWTVGLTVVWPDDAQDDDAVVCGPAGLPRWSGRAARVPVVASALRPLGVRFAEPVPDGVRDFGVEVWGQPDAFTSYDPPTGDDDAVPGTTQGDLWADALDGVPGLEGRGRLLTSANPASESGLVSFTGPLARAGSTVWLHAAAPEQVEATAAAERATLVW